MKISIIKENNINYSSKKEIFQMVENCFKLLELDKKNINNSNWNPLGDDLIKPGNTVLIKPNLVLEENQGGFGEECLYTNCSVVAPVIEYVWKALQKKGKIILADAPVQSCNFEKLINNSGYYKMVEEYQRKGINLELKDLRGLISKYENGVLVSTTYEKDGIVIDLKQDSEHAKIQNIEKVRITNYDPTELLKHHNKNKHEYFIAKEALEADVINNIPKPKAHRKAGITIGLKNFVGVNVRKEYLPHHKLGDKKHGGDEYNKSSYFLRLSSKLLDVANKVKGKKHYKMSKILRILTRVLSGVDKKFISKEKNREGSWYGNDTIWRTITDINKIIQYADKNGKLCKTRQRKIFNIADMIIIGEKEGPLLPSPKYGGIIAASRDIVCFDEVIATILGFDIKKIPLYINVRKTKKYTLSDNKEGTIISNNKKWNNKNINNIKKEDTIQIEPSNGWKNYIEL